MPSPGKPHQLCVKTQAAGLVQAFFLASPGKIFEDASNFVQRGDLPVELRHALLVQGPAVTHYWDPSGDVGREFQATLDIPMHAWDVWLLYDPGTRWDAQAIPPSPALWQHQLPSLPDRLRLDPEAFAKAVTQRLDEMPKS